MNRKEERWIKQVTSLIPQSQELPMWGALPSFPWEEFSAKLKDLLNLKKLSITPGLSEWKKEGAALKGMGNSPLQLGIVLSPIEGSLSLVFPSENFSKLSSWAIHSKASAMGFSDPYLQKGFFRFLALEALSLISNIEMFSGLSPKLTDLPLPSGDAYCVDIAIEYEKETILGRLIFSSLFHSSFKARVNAQWQLSIPSHLYSEIFLSLSLSPGQLSLSQEKFKKLKHGDFLFLDYS
ncbi:MAG: hypothetical protein HYZ47_01845, partial [Simkania negevensis]|nr:hypothetical protein [Simkania negevensis]